MICLILAAYWDFLWFIFCGFFSAHSETAGRYVALFFS